MAKSKSNKFSNNVQDLTGQIFGRLTVVEFAGLNKWQQATWRCACTCGNEHIANANALKAGNTKSCGCLQKEGRAQRSHGMAYTRVYRIWKGVLARCRHPEAERNKNYSGRGIGVCERWETFENFYEDMGDPPTKKHSIDRIDVNGDYTPDNCRWATTKQQCRNKRENVSITFAGKTQLLIEWSKELDINYFTLWSRMFLRNWPVEKALTEPVQDRNRN